MGILKSEFVFLLKYKSSFWTWIIASLILTHGIENPVQWELLDIRIPCQENTRGLLGWKPSQDATFLFPGPVPCSAAWGQQGRVDDIFPDHLPWDLFSPVVPVSHLSSLYRSQAVLYSVEMTVFIYPEPTDIFVLQFWNSPLYPVCAYDTNPWWTSRIYI